MEHCKTTTTTTPNITSPMGAVVVGQWCWVTFSEGVGEGIIVGQRPTALIVVACVWIVRTFFSLFYYIFFFLSLSGRQLIID